MTVLRLSYRAGPLLTAQLVLCSDEKMLLIQRGLYGDVEEARHHLVVRLLATPHGYVRVRIVWIFFRIVIPRDPLSEKSLERKLSQERRIAFEACAPISYNLEVVYQLGRFIGWLEQTTKANVDTASF